MKTLKMTVASYKKLLTATLVSIMISGCSTDTTATNTNDEMITSPDSVRTAPPHTNNKKKIKVALLIDTSNSMDGLIDQAKAQLWKIINELAKAKCENEKPDIEISLYEYGNDRLPSSEGYIRQVTIFTSDLDLISEKLFGLTTNGGSEFCGQVIQCALQQLEWSANKKDLQLIFIAGNEPFTQGPVSYAASCRNAVQKDVVVNTIFCGNFDEGINTSWKNGADFTGGNYMSIEQNKKTEYIQTPYDKQITDLNNRLNNTYVGYGRKAEEKKCNQLKQDANAGQYGAQNEVCRIVAKSSCAYKNSDWDLVDAKKEKSFDVSKIREEELPAEIQGKPTAVKEEYIEKKSKEREQIQAEINKINVKRSAYISEQEKIKGTEDNTLDAAMIIAIKTQAGKKNFVFEK